MNATSIESLNTTVTIFESALCSTQKETATTVGKVADGTFFIIQQQDENCFPLVFIKKNEKNSVWKKENVYQSDKTKSGVVYSLANDIVLDMRNLNYGGLPFKYLSYTAIKRNAQKLGIKLQ